MQGRELPSNKASSASYPEVNAPVDPCNVPTTGAQYVPPLHTCGSELAKWGPNPHVPYAAATWVVTPGIDR